MEKISLLRIYVFTLTTYLKSLFRSNKQRYRRGFFLLFKIK
jgi:hypothetical protein